MDKPDFQDMTKEQLIVYMDENMIHKDSQMFVAVSCQSRFNTDTNEYEPVYEPMLNLNYKETVFAIKLKGEFINESSN